MNGIALRELAEAWETNTSTLSRVATGKYFPTPEIILRAYRLSAGRVTFFDWVEGCPDSVPSPLLSIVKEFKHGPKATIKIPGRGRPPGRKTSVKDAAA